MILTQDDCDICGGVHHPSHHGESLLVVDHGRDTLLGGTRKLIDECMALVGLSNYREQMVPLNEEGYDLYQRELNEDMLSYNESCDLHESISEFCNTAEESLSAILSEAGYVLTNNSDAGCWLVFEAIPEDFNERLEEGYEVVREAMLTVLNRYGLPVNEAGARTVLEDVLLNLEEQGFVLAIQPDPAH